MWNVNRRNITQKRRFPGLLEGLKMVQVWYKWKGTATPVVGEEQN